ncbi:MAG: nuclear transport factor 2 family protein, partial [Chlamydiia bacterium]|nr:nuclear transport factor 2 family protein [Chlamydiia bacterium]
MIVDKYSDMERIYQEWDRALSANDMDASLALYAPDASIESPLIPYLTNSESGVITGHDAIRKLLETVAERKPPIRKFYRKGFLTDGITLMFEYPRQTPHGEQMDFME